MKIYYYIIHIILIATLFGCASVNTKVTSFVDPKYSKSKFSKPVVIAILSPLEDRLLLENSLVQELSKHGITPIPGVKVLPPTREFNEDDLKSSLSQIDWDSILVITKNISSNFETIKYEVTLFGNDSEAMSKASKAWIGSVVTNFRYPTYVTKVKQYNSTSKEIVKKLISDGLM